MIAEKMSVEQLRRRIRFHLSTAMMFERRSVPKLAKEFRALAGTYRQELESRMPAPASAPGDGLDGDVLNRRSESGKHTDSSSLQEV